MSPSHRHHIKNGMYHLPCYVLLVLTVALMQKYWQIKWAHLFTQPYSLSCPHAMSALLLCIVPGTSACSSKWIFSQLTYFRAIYFS